ncbi:MAG: hypothetical protein ACR2MP_07220 [Streptosporangiaceae bacterium]
MPCQFPEHHGHGSAGVSAGAGAGAFLVVAVVVAECVSHAAVIVTALAVVLAAVVVVAVPVGLLVRRMARSRACMIVRPGLPPAAPRPAALTARPARPARGRLPAPAQVRAIAPPPRQIVTAEILEVRREAPRPGA